MSQPTANEQFLLELINAERAKVGAQPLAFDGHLNDSAERHSQWMIDADVFSHTGVNGSTSTDRMKAAGFVFSGSWASAENIAWASLRGPSGYEDEVQLLHTNLMNSPGHRANLLNPEYREIGIGFEVGEFQGWQAAFVTENFAKSGTGSFLTGVAFNDRDGDKHYDPGEGMGGLSVKAVSSTGQSFAATTMGAGGYDLALPSGTYAVTFSGSGDRDHHQAGGDRREQREARPERRRVGGCRERPGGRGHEWERRHQGHLRGRYPPGVRRPGQNQRRRGQ